MNIELPKDAEGREIPLDTKVLYFKNGSEHKVAKWVLYPHEGIRWAVVFDNEVRRYPDVLFLTPPDSWERLEGDAQKNACDYFGVECDSEAKCRMCPHFQDDRDCSLDMNADIVRRAKRPRGWRWTRWAQTSTCGG